MASKLYSAIEVAGLLGVELDTLYRYARSGKLVGIKLGKLWRFREADVETFLNRHTRGTPPEDEPTLLPAVLGQVARHYPEAGVRQGARRWTYGEIDRASDRLAAALARVGIRPGDRVLVVLPTCIEFVVSCFAVWKVRALLVAEYSGIRGAQLRHVMGDSRPAALIVEPAIVDRLEDMPEALAGVRVAFVQHRTFALSGADRVTVESLDEAVHDEVGDRSPRWEGAEPTDVVSISYTSGSTGAPKGVMHTHEGWLASAAFTRDHVGLTAEDAMAVSLPLHHGLAFRQILASVLTGANLELASDLYQALRLVRGGSVSALLLVPAAASIVIDNFADLLREADRHLRYVEIGSAALPPHRLRQLRTLLPSTEVHLPYGLTEARVGFLAPGSDGALNRLVATAPGLRVDVVDDAGEPVRPGHTGQIRLAGAGLMKGYWQHAAVGAGGVFLTGDMGQVTEAGDIEILGRLDDMLKVGGRKVNPTEVELAISAHPDVIESAIVPVEDDGEIFECALHAHVVLKPDANLDKAALIEHCRQRLEPYKLPTEFHIRSSLPKSPVGKVLRHALIGDTSPAPLT